MRMVSALGWLGLGLLAADADAAVGRTDATYGVTQNGAVSYSIPIRVTDGINGLTPDLALDYAGPGIQTILGVGFELTGISYIAPCPKTIAQDTAAAPVMLASGDRYCLDDARLRLVSGTYGATNSTYRTELDQLVLITALASTNNIPGWFKVQMPDGLEYEYGNSTDSKLLASGTGGAPPQFWALSKISDSNGNAVVFHYDTDNTLRRFRPDSISYTERGGSGHYQIKFVYQSATLSEPIVSYTPSSTGGAAHKQDKLLERIELWHDTAVYRKILLAYENGAGSNQRLSSIQECVPGTPDDCLPATQFDWVSATSGHSSPVPSFAVTSSAMPLDINRDGIEDLAWAASGTWRYMLGSASGFGAVQNTGITATNPSKAMPLEWNGDGFWDLLVDWSDGKWRVIKGSASGLLTTTVQAGPTPGIPSNTANTSWSIGDMNGDGLDDLLSMQFNAAYLIKVRINGATGFGSEQTAFQQLLMHTTAKGFIRMDGASAIRRPDFNGDGRGDLLVYGCEWDPEPPAACYAYGWYQLISNGTTLVNQGMLPYASYTIDARFADFNGDGLTDVGYAAQTPGLWYMGFGQGGGGLAIVPGPSSTGYTNYLTLTGDYDGDGYDDFYAGTTSTPQWHVFRGSANGLATSPVLTGISAIGNGWLLSDQNGDGLPDLGRYDISTFVWSTHAHAGVAGEQLESAIDGLGNKVSFTYLPMTDNAVYVKGSGAIAPVIDVEFNASLVRTMQLEPAGGSPYFLTYKYRDARSHTQGRWFLGMAKREITDSRNGVFTSEVYRQDFPYIGAPDTATVKQSSAGSTIQSVTHTYTNHLLEPASGNQRYLPYRSKTVTKVYEVGGLKNGLQITEITEDHTVSLLGNSTFVSVKHEDKDAGSAELGSNWRTEVTSTFSENTFDWCLALPLTRSEKRILPGGTNQTRAASWQVDTANCRVDQETIEPGAGNTLSLVTDIGYDLCGNVDSLSSYPAGQSGQARTTGIGYGTRCQRPESITNPLNQTSNIAYDWPLALPSSHTDPNGIAVGLVYDGFGRLTRQDNPDGTDVAFSLTACTAGNGWCGKNSGARVKVTRNERKTTDVVLRTDELFLDGVGRVRWSHADSLESGAAVVETLYDAFGRPSQQSQPYFAGGAVYATSYLRDLIGRVTQIDAPISESATSGRITGFVYEGRDLKVTDPEGNLTTRRSNAIGQLRAVVDPNPGGTTNYAYRPFGELASITDAANNITSWTHNLRGFVTGTTDPDSGSWVYESNAFGDLEKIRDAKTVSPNWSAQFTYDKLARPWTRIESEGTTTWNWGTSGTANNIGRLASITSPGSYSEVFTFDSIGRLAQQAVTADGATYNINLTYVPSTGLLNTLEYPISTSGYRLKLGYEYANALLKRVKDANGTTVFWEGVSTDAWGHYQDESLGNGVLAITDFDQASGLMASREAGVGGGTGRINAVVAWADDRGNFTERQDLKLTPAVTEAFTNDGLSRFDSSTLNGPQNLDVTLDAIGNITFKGGQNYVYTGNQTGCTYYAHPQPRAVRKIGSTVYCYDPNGNMTKRGGSTISYTSYNLPTVINSGSNSSTLSYGAFRNRYKQVAVSSGTTETTIYIAGLFEKITRPGGVIEYRHYLPGGQGIASIHTRRTSGGNSTYYWHSDHLGSPELFTDSAGTVQVRPSFGAYGERRDGSDWSGPPSAGDLTTIGNITRRGFTGHEHLDAVGMIHMNGRVYDPGAGRFLSRDPFIDGVFNSQGVNGYAYVHNNPLTFIDPSGFCHSETSLCPQPHRREPRVDPGTRNEHDRTTMPGQQGATTNAFTGVNMRALFGWLKVTSRAMRGAAEPDSTVGGTTESVAETGSTWQYWLTYATETAGWALVVFDVVNTVVSPTPDVGIIGASIIGSARVARAITPSSRALGRALEAAGIARPAGSAAHHVVAGSAPGAAAARATLQRLGVGINDAANGVFLPGARHASLHTAEYFEAVNRALAGATTRAQAEQILQSIARGLQAGTFP